MGGQRRTEQQVRIAHAVAGARIVIEAGKELGEREPGAAATMAALGFAMLLLAALHRRLHHSAFSRHLDSVAFLIEAAVLGVIAHGLLNKGKHYLPWVYVLAAAIYVGLAIWRNFRPLPHESATA